MPEKRSRHQVLGSDESDARRIIKTRRSNLTGRRMPEYRKNRNADQQEGSNKELRKRGRQTNRWGGGRWSWTFRSLMERGRRQQTN